MPSQVEETATLADGAQRSNSDLIYGPMGAPNYRGVSASEIVSGSLDMAVLHKKHQDQQATITAIALLVFFGGLFLLSFISKRRKRIVGATEDAMVSALASIVKAKRHASSARNRLMAKVNEKLDGEKSPPERP